MSRLVDCVWVANGLSDVKIGGGLSLDKNTDTYTQNTSTWSLQRRDASPTCGSVCMYVGVSACVCVGVCIHLYSFYLSFCVFVCVCVCVQKSLEI